METTLPAKASKTILIVEDQDAMRASLRDFLQSAYPDCDIVGARDGVRGMQLCHEKRPQLVLMDVQLPDANGIDLTLQIKAMLPDTVVIIVSSHCGPDYVEHALTNGALAYITKDKVHCELLPAIACVLDVPPANQRTDNPAFSRGRS